MGKGRPPAYAALAYPALLVLPTMNERSSTSLLVGDNIHANYCNYDVNDINGVVFFYSLDS
jgi:hypothetical protein